MSVRTPPRTRRSVLGLSLAGVGASGLIATTLAPRLSDAPGRPPLALLLGVGLALVVVAAVGVYVAIRTGLGLPGSVAVYGVGYHALILVVKFVLAPYGIYDLNREVALESYVPFTESIGTFLATVFVFLLYFLVYGVLYRIVRHRAGLRRERHPDARRRSILVVLSIAGALLLMAASGLGVLFLPLLPAASGLDYLRYLFSSSAALLVAVALAGATWLAARTLGSAAEQAQAVGDATLLVSVFWVGLGFIALYHFLWLVYLLALLSVWPLRVVVPK